MLYKDEFGNEIKIGYRIYNKYMLQYGTVNQLFEEDGWTFVLYTPDDGSGNERAACRSIRIAASVGDKRNPTTCWDGSVIHAEVYDGHMWVPTGEKCPEIPAHGTKRNPITCWDGSVIYREWFHSTLRKWLPSVSTCPDEPECTGIEYDLTATTDPRNIWHSPPMKLSAVNRTNERVDAPMGVWLDGRYKAFYDQPLATNGSVTMGINQYIKAGSYGNSLCLTDGSHVIETPDRKKKLEITVKETKDGELRSPVVCWNGKLYFKEVYRDGEWVSTGESCPPMPAHGTKRSPITCWDDSVIYAEVFDATLMKWVPTGAACPTMPAHGAKRSPTTCWDESVIYAEMFVATLKKWVPTGATCPVEPAHWAKRSPTTCWDGSVIYAEVYNANLKKWVPTGAACPTMPAHGAKRSPTTCWDESVIYAEMFDANLKNWVPTGAACPVEPVHGERRNLTVCWNGSTSYEVFDATLKKWVLTGDECPTEPAHGTKRNLTTCWDDSVIYTEVYNATLNRWVSTGYVCPTKPECTEGDKKAGYVCVAGKWQPAPAVPEPVVKPVPEPVPPADEMFTIEFQEMISGITPPRVPLLIPGLESLPLLPGWIVRDAAGNIVNKGMELPTLPGI